MYPILYIQSPNPLPTIIYVHNLLNIQSLKSPLKFSLHNSIQPLRSEEASQTKHEQSACQAPKPNQIALIFLSWNPNIHAPETGNDVHGKDNGTKDSQFTEDVGGLFGALVHPDVDLSEIVTV